MASASASQEQLSRNQQHSVAEDFEVGAEADQFQSVDELERAGINVREIETVKNFGIHSVDAVLATPIKTLIEQKGITEAKAEKMKTAARTISTTQSRLGFQCCTSLFQEESERFFKISTGERF